MEKSRAELRDYLPSNWQVSPCGNHVQIIAPDFQCADLFLGEEIQQLKESSLRLNCPIEIWWEGCDRPFRVSSAAQSPQPNQEPIQRTIGSYGASTIERSASMESTLDFIKGKKSEGLIVTVTSMVDDKCLIVNDLQALDRGGGWNAQKWIGIDFKNLWRDSFLPRKTNYFARLIESIEQDGHIPEFHYQIRRPSGALGEYSSTYFLLDNFLGAPARVAVSKVGAWPIVEDAPDGSEFQ